MKRSLVLHNFYAPGRPESALFEAFAAAVARLTEGSLSVDVASSNRLGLDDADGLQWLANGKADLAVLWPVFLQQRHPELQASYVMGSPRHLADHQNALPALESIDRVVIAEHGIELIAALPSPVLHISIFSSGEPVTSLAALRGRRLRVFSRDLEPTFRRLGADADFIPQGELYAALEAGRFDCTVYPACHTAWSVPLWRVTQHAAYLFPEALHPYLLCAAPQAWASLDESGRAALRQAAESVYPDFLRLSIDDGAERAARRNLQAAGLAWHQDFSASDRSRFADSAALTWRDMSDAAGARATSNYRSVLTAMGRPIPG
jgi:TRAP-type C4-dicarboxylate transport system substrate-binding protein